MGDGAQAQQAGGIAIGDGANAVITNSVAIGAGAVAQSSVAVGGGAQATGANSTALGDNATASEEFSVALGAGSVADQPNTVSIGAPGSERRLTNLADGIDAFDAVNLRQLDGVRDYARNGIAAVLAIPPIVMPTEPGRVALAVELGAYDGAGAVGLALAYRMFGSWAVNVGGSYPFDGDHAAVRGGLAVEF
jgi:autotransporter adhesin